MAETRKIAFYGKGGIGKSTTLSNVSAYLAVQNNKVIQIGCDPKKDSTRNLLKGYDLDSVLNIAKEKGSSFTLEDIMKTGFANVDCIEAGGPEPGIGCAGRGIILVMEILKKFGVFEKGYDYAFYDILGDVVCGGFAAPIRESYAEEVYLVVSGEFMSIYAANNICKALKRFGERGKVRLAGVIGNSRNVKNERAIIESFAKKIGTEMVGFMPRDNIVQEAESKKQTVIEFAPDSDQAREYAKLAEIIVHNKNLIVPSYIFTEPELEQFYFHHVG